MTDKTNFQAVMARYYKAKSQKADDCLGDIIQILDRDVPDEVQVNAILERLAKYYEG